MTEDEQVVRRVVSGEREAFRLLVVTHQSAVCATIRALLGGAADWEDLGQEVFLAAFQHLATFDPNRGSFRTWLLAIARNRCRNALRRPASLQLEAVLEQSHDRTPDQAAMEAECFQRLDEGLAALPESQRELFVLIELQGLSYEEAAHVSEVSVGTVKSRLSRAKARLRELLQAVSFEIHESS
ncbi:MAG: RNA polymerase sigma factor [Planctomycetales bacterium]